jgi:hypothetical protein
VLALMVARNSFGRDRIRLALICPSPRSGFSPAVEESVLEHNYRLTVIRPQSLAKLPTSGPGQLPYCPSLGIDGEHSFDLDPQRRWATVDFA